MKKIPHSMPTITKREAEAIARVLDSGYHARGPECEAFEAELAEHVGLKSAHSCSSGSAALVLAQRGLGLMNGARILIPTLACAAVAHAVIEAGNEIVLYDGDYDLPTLQEVESFSDADGLIVIAPMEGWKRRVPQWHGGPTILDRCQQLSAQGPHSRENADCEVFSFYATKCISTGSGGAIASNDSALIERVAELNSPDKQENWRPERFNYGFDDIRAAIGREQLKALPEFVARRRGIADKYTNGPSIRSQQGIAFRYLEHYEPEQFATAQSAYTDAGIDTKRPVFGLLHRQLGLSDENFPRATYAWESHLSLPIYPNLRDEEASRVSQVIRQLEQSLD